MKILSKEDIADRLSPISDACIDKLCWYADEEAFIKSAKAYIRIIRKVKPHKSEPAAEAQKRINRVKKAFDKLTQQDKLFLDVNTSNSDDYPLGLPHVCESMQRALDTPVPKRLSLSRDFLAAFARKAIRSGWIDVSAINNTLVPVLEIMMKEAGVKHNATVIASEAKKAMKTT